MSKKERMLNHIQNNVNWFLTTDASVEVIPYYSLTQSVFSRVQEYISGYVDIDEVVCLVSTSIWEIGKSGILFTTDAMYCKSWGLLTTKYVYYYWEASSATFDFHNDFYENRMKEIMGDLYKIGTEEDENEKLVQNINDIIDVGKKVGGAVLGGMALLNMLSSIGDSVVSHNNDKIAQEIAKLENSNNPTTVNAITIYKEFIPLIDQFVNICEIIGEEGDNISEDTYYAAISSLLDILVVFYNQTIDKVDVSPEDEEEYTKYENWLAFWAIMFYDGDQFREIYPIELLKEMPECWDAIIDLMDEILEDVWEESFSEAINRFAESVIDNIAEIMELMSSSDWDEDFVESVGKVVESNNRAVKDLRDILDNATDFLNDLLPDGDDE